MTTALLPGGTLPRDTFTTGLGGLAGMAAMPTSLMMDLAVRSGGQVQAAGTEAVEAPSLGALYVCAP